MSGNPVPFTLPVIGPEDALPPDPPPTWEQQMAHARMLLAWRKAQGLDDGHPPHCDIPFVLP